MTGDVAARDLRSLPVVHTGQPAPFAVTAPAYVAAVSGWLAAAIVLAFSAGDLARAAYWDGGVVLGAHLVGLVLFPFAVAAAAWQLLPVMLRNDPATTRLRPLAVALIAAGGPLAAGVATGRDRLAAVAAGLLAAGLVVLLAEILSLVRGAPAGKTLVVSRPAVALAGAHAAAAFALGALALSQGVEPLGIPYDRFLLLHVSVALLGWLTLLIATVGRTLVPMLGLAAAAPRRRAPAAELVLVAGLWTYAAGLVAGSGALVAGGIGVMAAGLAPTARLFARVARAGRIGIREGPVAHAAVGLVLLGEAGVVGAAGALGALSPQRAAVAGVLLAGLGWAAGMIVGHLGKLVSLSGWGSWPPGPRPRQEALYPRRLWQVEVVLFAAGVQLLAIGVLARSAGVAGAGGGALAAGALVAVLAVLETLRRVGIARRRVPER